MNIKIFKIFFFIILISPVIAYSQADRQEVGNEAFLNQQGGFYNYGGKDKVNIYVNIWGYVKFPGKYLIPKGSTVQDLISYSGGPNTESKLEDIILFRPKSDSLNISKDRMIRLDYNDLFWTDEVSAKNKLNPELIPGDVLIIRGEPRYFARDNVNFILSISAVLISLGILITTLVR